MAPPTTTPKTQTMERSRRLSSLWSWLPGFRAIAETEHLPTASQALHVSPPALSRTLRLLEEDVGQPLFDRVGRRIVLNPAGRVLLSAVRSAMRTVDEALAVIGEGQLVGPVHISVPGPFASIFVLPALDELREQHPGLVPHLRGAPSSSVPSMLLRGDLDLALLDDPVAHEELHVERLVRLTHGVYCGRGHPLFEARRASREQVLAHAFVAPAPDPRGVTPDAWPAGEERTVALRVARMQTGLDACASGSYLCVLPDLIAQRAGLRRLSFEGTRATELHMVHRRSIEIPGKTERVAEALRAAAAAVAA